MQGDGPLTDRSSPRHDPWAPGEPRLSHLRRPAFLTRLGLIAERGTRAFWPVWTVAFVAAAPLLMRFQDDLPPQALWLWLAFWALVGIGFLIRGALRFRWPTADDALERVDATLPGRPIAAIRDQQAIGGEDAASVALWQAHVARMADRSRSAAAVPPDLRLSDRDPFGLRLIALLLFVVALVFGPRALPQTQGAITTTGQVAEAGPSWEGWVEPPAYTGKPTLYLADIPPGTVELVAGSRVTLRLYGDADANAIQETVSTPLPEGADPLPEGQFIVARAGRIEVTGAGGAAWDVILLPDLPPTIAFDGEREVDAMGEMAQPFHATDDYAVQSGTATITLDLAAVDRRFGLATDPDPREPLVLDLPMPFTGDRADFTESLIENLSEHPFANLPVTLVLTARDAAGQEAATEAMAMTLPGRRFFQPVAKAVIELRRDILWSRANAGRSLNLMRAIADRPDDLFTSETIYLRHRAIIRQLDGIAERGTMTEAEQEEIAKAMWDLAIQLEEGTLADARARLERAQERLSEAMENGASPEEIAELMQELRDATQDYLEMLAQNAQPAEDQTDQPESAQTDSQEVTQDQIQAMMDRIQELMEEGRMAEAEELMAQLNELLQNLQMTQGEGQGGGFRSPGQQSMEDMQETLRDQQDLSDDAFRQLQDEFNGREPQNGQQSQPGGEPQGNQPGRQDGAQPGQDQGQQQGQNQGGQTDQQGNPSGDPSGDPSGSQQGAEPGQEGEGSLADRQQALRGELERQRQALPGLTGEAADRARDQLDRAEGAMDRAEEALRDGDLAQAIDDQAEALNALREGLRNLGEALAQNNRDPEDQTGEAQQTGEGGTRTEPARRDPLGRQLGQNGQYGSDQNLLQGPDVYRRAEELLQELRRRAGERGRDEAELDYLRRLLEQF